MNFKLLMFVRMDRETWKLKYYFRSGNQKELSEMNKPWSYLESL